MGEDGAPAAKGRIHMRVNCNISSLLANNNLSVAQTKLDKALERLSSGLKINSAEDDAAGLAIANKLHSQIKGLDQANRNSSDGISVIQTAESALNETESILQRINELAVQAANGTNSLSDRQAIQSEIDQLTDEIDRISNATEFNTMPLLDGTLSRRSYSDTDNVSMFYVSSGVKEGEYSIDITADARKATAQVDFNAQAITESGKIQINGADMTVEPGDTDADLKSKFISLCDAAGLDYDEATGQISTYGYGMTQKIEYKIPNSLVGVFSINNVTAGADAQAAINAGFGTTATLSTNGNFVTVKDIGGFEMTIELGENMVASSGQASVTATQKVTQMGTMTVQLGANEGQVLEVDIPEVGVHTLGLDNLNVCTQQAAEDAITRVGKAIDKVSSARSVLGAYQNRLDSVVTHLDSYEEDLTSAVSGIEDSDMADEMTEYTQQNVITQAATSMLAQANERPQTVLQLLQ